jgi:hypothetical protein
MPVKALQADRLPLAASDRSGGFQPGCQGVTPGEMPL